MNIRDATSADGPDMAHLINLAGDGIPEFLWSGMAEPGQKPMEVGAQRAARGQGDFRHANTRMACAGDSVVGMVVSYQLDDPYETGDLDEYPPVVRPLIELEALVPGSWYINAIATYPESRGKGVATRLLAEAEERARAAGCEVMSLIVATANKKARALYLRLGYDGVENRPVVNFPGGHLDGDWELMVKNLTRGPD